MSPGKIVLASIFFYVFVWVVAPVEVIYGLSWLSFSLLFLMFLSLLVGALSCGMTLSVYPAKTPNHIARVGDKAKKLFKFFLILTVVGMAFRFYDKVFIRDISSYSSAVERRDSETSASIFGVISAPLYILALTLPAFFRQFKSRLKLKAFVFLLFAIPAIEVIYMGSRGLFITSFFMLAMYIWYLWGVRFKFVVFFTALALFFFYVSGGMFVDRIESYGISPIESAFNSVYAFTLVPNDYAVDVVDSGEAWSGFFFFWVNAAQYYLHGSLEFSYLIDNFTGFDYQFGGYTFRVIGKLMGSELSGMGEWVTPRSGVYTTLLGPLWVDFGPFAFVFLFFWGWFMMIFFRKVKSGKFQYLPIYSYMSAVVFFAPVVNLIQNALGVYVITACMSLVFGFYVYDKFSISKSGVGEYG